MTFDAESQRGSSHLLEVDELWFGQTHLVVDKTPLLTSVATEKRVMSCIGVKPLVHHVVDIGDGYAVCGDGVFRPLADKRLLR